MGGGPQPPGKRHAPNEHEGPLTPEDLEELIKQAEFFQKLDQRTVGSPPAKDEKALHNPQTSPNLEEIKTHINTELTAAERNAFPGLRQLIGGFLEIIESSKEALYPEALMQLIIGRGLLSWEKLLMAIAASHPLDVTIHIPGEEPYNVSSKADLKGLFKHLTKKLEHGGVEPATGFKIVTGRSPMTNLEYNWEDIWHQILKKYEDKTQNPLALIWELAQKAGVDIKIFPRAVNLDTDLPYQKQANQLVAHFNATPWGILNAARYWLGITQHELLRKLGILPMEVITNPEIQPRATGESVIFLWRDCKECPGGVTFTVNRSIETLNSATVLLEEAVVITPATGRKHKHEITFEQPASQKPFKGWRPTPLDAAVQNFLQRYRIREYPDTINYGYAVTQKFVVPQGPGEPGEERITSQITSVSLTTNRQGRVGRIELRLLYEGSASLKRTLLMQFEHPSKDDPTIQCKLRIIEGGEELGLSAKAWDIHALKEATLALPSAATPDLLLGIIDPNLQNITQETSTIYPQKLTLQLAKKALEVLDKKIQTRSSNATV